MISSCLFNKKFYNNSACIFSQKDYYKDNVYIVFGEESLNLKCYDYTSDRTYILIYRLHKDWFNSVRHFYDDIKSRDLILTSSHDNHVKVINFKKEDSSVILDLNCSFYKEVIINTAYFIDNKIIVPHAFHFGKNRVCFFNLEGEKIGELKDDPGFILCINCYTHSKIGANLALISNKQRIYVFNIDNYYLYNKFTPNIFLKSKSFAEATIIEKDEKFILFGPLFDKGFLFMWDLISKQLVNTITLSTGITDICLWNNNFIFATLSGGKEDKFVLIFSLKF